MAAQDQLPSNRPLKCDVCNVWCSGNISYQNHLEGRPHYIALQKRKGVEFGGPDGCGNGNGNWTDGPPPKKMKKSSGVTGVVRCDVCNLEVTKEAYEQHLKGVRHSKKVKENEVAPEVSSLPHIVVSGNGYRCEVCNVDMSGKVVVLSHVAGSKHKKRLTNPATPQNNSLDKPPNEQFECKVCHIFVNSPLVLKQHEGSAKHQHKAEMLAKQAAQAAELEAARKEANVGQPYDAWDPHSP